MKQPAQPGGQGGIKGECGAEFVIEHGSGGWDAHAQDQTCKSMTDEWSVSSRNNPATGWRPDHPTTFGTFRPQTPAWTLHDTAVAGQANLQKRGT